MAGALVACGALFFSLMSLCIKITEKYSHCTAFGIFAIRCAIGLTLNSFAVICEGQSAVGGGSGISDQPPQLSRRRRGLRRAKACCRRLGAPTSVAEWAWLTVRSLGGFAGVVCEYTALQALPLGIQSMIVYSSPAWIVVWAAILLREKIRLPVAVCLLVCFGGLSLIVQPWKQNADHPLWAYAAAMTASLLAGLVYVALKEMKHVRYHFILNGFMFVGLTLSIAVGFALRSFEIPEWGSRGWGFLIGAGCCAYAAEVCVTLGFARTTPETLGQVAVLKFLAPIFSTTWGIFCFSTPLPPLQIAGMVLVLTASCGIMLLRSKPAAEDAVDDKSEDSTSETSTEDGDSSTEMEMAVR